MTLEKLEEIREKIAALEIETLTPAVEHGYFRAKEDILEIFDSAIAEDGAKPEPGDVVATALLDGSWYEFVLGLGCDGCVAGTAPGKCARLPMCALIDQSGGWRRKIEEAGE